MEIQQQNILMIVPENELMELKENSMKIISILERKNNENITRKWIPADEFMKIINIRRSKFDEIKSKLKTIKKKRKIYVAVEEIDRYFDDETFN